MAVVPFVAGLSAHADRLAVVGPDADQLTYRALAGRMRAAAQHLGPGRRLVLVATANDVDSLVGYLAALHAGHPVLLCARDDQRQVRRLIATYDPDVVVDGAGPRGMHERRAGSAHTLHAELALLLCTSGSTGSPKLVRLGAAGLQANAAAIADYLDIRDTDRAAATLPMHYCYGLSVVNSNLLRGAALLLSDRSVTDPEFWSTVRDHRGTSIHGVPFTFELLDRVGFPEMRLPHLRYVTQAGGRLEPRTVRRYAELGTRQGWRLFVMYGQTEATARMAYLPPERAAASPSAVGVPIPGGRFEIEHVEGTDAGELVYRGPNVMLGYAEGPVDLAEGRTVEALRTGDLARRRSDGLYEVVGRRNRFVKPFGVRIDLDGAERMLSDIGAAAACTGDDDELVVAVAGRPEPEHLRRLVAGRLALPAGRVRVIPLDELPRLPNGKLDHRAVDELAAARRARPGRRRLRPRSVHDAFRTVFGVADLPEDATFVSLGGDSLSYVQMTVELQRVLGELPAGWPTTPVGRLAQLRPRQLAWPTMETGVALRAVAIVLVVGSHVGLFHVLGGAHLLLGVAGWAFARFVLAAPAAVLPRRILRSAVRIAVPSVLWIASRAPVQDDIGLSNALLVNGFIDPAVWGYWYVETLCQMLLLFAVVFAVPGVRRLERAHPFHFAVLLLAGTLVGRLFPDPGNEFSDRLMSTHLLLWLFVLGWVLHRASTTGQRWAAAALVVLLVPGFFDDPLRAVVVTSGLLLLLLVPRIAVPRWAVRPLGTVAAASLSIYLTHYAVFPALEGLPAPVVVATCVAVGVAAWWGCSAVLRRFRAVTSGRLAGSGARAAAIARVHAGAGSGGAA